MTESNRLTDQLPEEYVDTHPPMDRYADFYSVRYYCTNCSNNGWVFFRKGKQKHIVLCSNCKCTVRP